MTEATGNGVKCSILSTTGDNADTLGIFPGAGTVSAEILVERGGPQLPEGDCIVTLQARGTDGISTSARGSTTVFVDVNDVNLQSTLTNIDITVRESKAVASLDDECFKWAKKQLKLRSKCNFLLLKKGVEKADKCKDAGPEPAGCDDGDHVEAILALAHDGNDQQTDPFNAEGVDFAMLRDQVVCQKRLGKAAANFSKKRMKLVQKKCLDANLDSEDCRDQQTNAAKKKLDQIDKCQGDQMVDGGSGLTVPDVAAPCDTCIVAGVIDRKCLKSCFQLAVAELTDGLIGDLPECGDGILQAPEFCDDGNLVNGDCCSDTCTVEAGSVEGPMGDATCTDLLDNDCDGDIDGADVGCQ
jgi:cysteine-rich repeat protein